MLRTLAADDTVTAHEPLRADLRAWLDRAWRAGLDDDSIEALFWTTLRAAHREASSKEETA